MAEGTEATAEAADTEAVVAAGDNGAFVAAGYTGATAAAEALVEADRLVELCRGLVDIASPAGEERALAEHVARVLRDAGLDGRIQDVDGDLVNAHGRVPSCGSGGAAAEPSLLLYAPLDTVTTGDPDEDLPWAGPELRPDLRPQAEVSDGLIVGLGAHNPKGHAACVIAAAEALARSGVALVGEVLVGLGGGGMPINARRPRLPDAHGRGCAALLDALRPDEAVIAKSGWAVSWEEVGLSWFEVEARGTHTYVGSRHLLPYRNAIADAAHLVRGLETWFERWADETGDDLVAPQGVVAAIEGGWPNTAAFTTALCRFWVDLRLSPRTSPDEAAAAFGGEVERLAAEIGADVDWRQTVAIAGTTTDPTSPIIERSIAAWEDLEGRPHAPIPRLSGATDANILRARGVPTARIGLPKVARPDLDVDFAFGMNAVEIDDLVRLTRLLVRIAVDRCGERGPMTGGEENR